MPASLDAERSILGAVLLDNDVYPQAAESLKAEDFSLDSHRRIYMRMTDLNSTGRPVDIITLTEELGRHKEVESVGGVAYISSLTEGLPRRENIEHYVKIVKDKAMLRGLIHAANASIARAIDQSDTTEEIIDAAESAIFQISESRIGRGFVGIKEIVKESFGSLDALYERGRRITGLETHYSELDQMTSGLQSSDLVIIAARPSMGKTAFAMNIAENVAVNDAKVVGMFSLEMSREALLLRLLCSQARVDAHKLRTGFLGKEDFQKLTSALSVLSMPKLRAIDFLKYQRPLADTPVSLPEAGDPAAVFEILFGRNGWGSSWRNGIYDYVHYHSGTHEALGIARGWGRTLQDGSVQLLGEIDAALVREALGDEPAFLAAFDQLALTSQLTVPMHAHGRLLGAITFAFGPGDRRYVQADVDLNRLSPRMEERAFHPPRAPAALPQDRLHLPHHLIQDLLEHVANVAVAVLHRAGEVGVARSRARDLCEALIAARVIDPKSKLATATGLSAAKETSLGEVLELGELDEDDLYRALDWLLEQQGDVVGVGPEADLHGHGDDQAEQQRRQRGLDGGLGRLTARLGQWKEGRSALI